jgi:predicted O-linked N-acetylglucosamine transferase (SPINDLY family)
MTVTEALQQAFIAIQREDWAKADALCRAVLVAEPRNFHALSFSGFVALRTDRIPDAERHLRDALAIQPDNPEILNNRGMALARLNRAVEALSCYDRALALNPNYPNAWLNRGNVLRDLKRSSEALVCFDRALAIQPDPGAWFNRGNVLSDLGRHRDALASYGAALAIDPRYAEACLNRGNAHRQLGDNAAALADYDRARALAPGLAEVHNNRGNALAALRRFAEAIESFEHALAIKPDDADSLNNLGNVLSDVGRDAEALACYNQAVGLKPDAGILVNRGNLLRAHKQHAEAVNDYAAALDLDPERDFLYGIWLHARMKICDWRNLTEDLARLSAMIEDGRRAALPFSVVSMTDSPALQRRAAETWIAASYPGPSAVRPAHPPHDRICVGYFSADLHDGAMTQLIAELFELHDRSRFHITGFSLGRDSEDAMRRRVVAAFDEFIDVREHPDDAIAALARDLEIDIAVDLNGFTQNNRTGIFARRAAPIQATYLGFPGTMGAGFIDYLIGDHTLISDDDRRWYAEKVVRFPDSYLINDRQKVISDTPVNRTGFGLPDSAFVFCCFNGSYKITPGMFDIWMRLLSRIERSVLWLLHDNDAAVANLRSEAAGRGIDPDRLVFAPHLPLAEHLARHRLADLFLDTLPCNAHTTASDALWSGLPVLTCPGSSFASRVAASLLRAIRLPELVAGSIEDYEAIAIRLAGNPMELQALRHRLADHRLTTPLFDSAQLTRHFESAYAAMVDAWRAGRAPDHIDLN